MDLAGGVVIDWYQSKLLSPWDIFDTNMGECVGHACTSVSCMSLTLAFHVLVALHHIDHGCSKVIMRNLMLILWNVLSRVYD